MSTNRQTAAGRLLDLVASVREGPALDELARRIGVGTADLEACRRGERPLSLEGQLRLAAAAAALGPEVERAARRLYAQAQAALRLEAEESSRHLIYPREHFV